MIYYNIEILYSLNLLDNAYYFSYIFTIKNKVCNGKNTQGFSLKRGKDSTLSTSKYVILSNGIRSELKICNYIMYRVIFFISFY